MEKEVFRLLLLSLLHSAELWCSCKQKTKECKVAISPRLVPLNPQGLILYYGSCSKISKTRSMVRGHSDSLSGEKLQPRKNCPSKGDKKSARDLKMLLVTDSTH